MNERIVALVPMRHSSERVVGKNYRMLAGKPLFHHIVQTLLEVPHIAEIVIDTDSPLITADVARAFPRGDGPPAARSSCSAATCR